MLNGRRTAALVLAALALGVSLAMWRSSPPESGDPTHAARAAAIRAQAPDLDRSTIDARMHASDEIRQQFGDVDVIALLNSVELTEADRNSFFERNRDAFGGRTYEESWMAVDRLLRIQRVREQLHMPASAALR